MPLLNKGDATINYRRCLRKKANKFTIIEGCLFYIGNKGNDEPRLVVSDQCMQQFTYCVFTVCRGFHTVWKPH